MKNSKYFIVRVLTWNLRDPNSRRRLTKVERREKTAFQDGGRILRRSRASDCIVCASAEFLFWRIWQKLLIRGPGLDSTLRDARRTIGSFWKRYLALTIFLTQIFEELKQGRRFKDLHSMKIFLGCSTAADPSDKVVVEESKASEVSMSLPSKVNFYQFKIFIHEVEKSIRRSSRSRRKPNPS